MRQGFWYGLLLGVAASAAALLVVAPRMRGRDTVAADGAGRVKAAPLPAPRRAVARAAAIARRPGR